MSTIGNLGSNTFGGLAQALGSAGSVATTTTGSWPAGQFQTYPTTGAIGYQYPDPIPPPTEAKVPILDKSNKAGLFLRDANGNLVHIETDKIYKAFGLTW